MKTLKRCDKQMEEKIKEKLAAISKKHGGKVLFAHSLKDLSTMRTGGSADSVYMAGTIEEIVDVKVLLDEAKEKMRVLGRGSNTLLPEGEFRGTIILLNGGIFQDIRFAERKVTVGSGVRLERFISECRMKRLSGMEGLIGIPATIGGAVRMNAGYKEEISDRLTKVLVLDRSNKIKWIDKEKIEFGYRRSSFSSDTFILAAEFEMEVSTRIDVEKKLKDLFGEKNEKQPLKERTLGCIFKNPSTHAKSAGELIDLCGMKGARSGGAVVSNKHANFIINDRDAKVSDITDLISKMRKAVKERFLVDLEIEIEIW
ncbi:MAG: UDP-N-acetylmuramate dehydrogenase [Candidatus Omnitrophota bacterium]